jgi:hypothetical protein
MTLQAVAEYEYKQAFLRPHDCVIELGDDYGCEADESAGGSVRDSSAGPGISEAREPSRRTNR